MRRTIGSPISRDTAPLYRTHKKIVEVSALLLQSMLQGVHSTPREKGDFIDTLLTLAKDPDISRYEREAKELVTEFGLFHTLPLLFRDRADLIYRQVEPHIPKRGRIIDYGCGNGVVGTRVSDTTVLADIYRHPNINNLDHEFVLLEDGNPSPFSNASFDCVLLLTVLHHSDTPDVVVADVSRILRSGGLAIVIESVYGLDSSINPEYFGPESREFLTLSSADQRRLNIFFDHFYNRILYDGVNCPFNFDTPSGWKARFESRGLKENARRYLGIDQPVVPEFHTLHVFEK